MAAALRRPLYQTRVLLNFVSIRSISSQSRRVIDVPKLGIVCACTSGAVAAWCLARKSLTPTIESHVSAASKGSDQRSSEKRAVLQTQRELRFLSFASIEVEGNIYMTPQDFLESVTEEAPRPRSGRSHLRPAEVEQDFRSTPHRSKGTSSLFRNLHERGLISYTEYLFLLCVLTKPKSGFKIAFNMFDTDGNQRVDKKEFLVLMELYHNRFGCSTKQQTECIRHVETPMNLWNKLRYLSQPYEGLITGLPDSQRDGDSAVSVLDTTLTVHFFGRKGNETLKYEDFHRFMDNLQTEVLELEFGEFSRGMQTITEVEFAQILLRYTILTTDEHEEYLQRLRSKVLTVKGVTFQEFKDFCQFLNNLDDFALAMRMYTYANHPISQDDFKRAVKACTGQSLSHHVVDVVYKLFDKDDDNHLSHKEFISVMKDRLHRGFRSYTLHQNNWDTFKSCVKNEIKMS